MDGYDEISTEADARPDRETQEEQARYEAEMEAPRRVMLFGDFWRALARWA